MSLSMYRVSVPVFVRGFEVLSALLDKASAHASEKGIDASVLVSARLAPDMLPLAAQIQRASDTSKLSIERLSGEPSPRLEDNETTIPELHERIAKTVAYLKSVDAAQLEGSEERVVTLSFGAFKPSFRGDEYLLTFGLPNFFFHLTTAYDILRHNGVQVGKLDFLGPYGGTAPAGT
jgi:hypothetical protein